MPIEMSCRNCGRLVRAKETVAGKRIRCPHCQAVVEVPVVEAPTAEAEDTPPAPGLDKFLALCTALGVLFGILGIALSSKGFSAFSGSAMFGFFLGLAVFSTVCFFAPSSTLSSPRVAALIGTANPVKARIACAIAALLFWPMGLFGVLGKFL